MAFSGRLPSRNTGSSACVRKKTPLKWMLYVQRRNLPLRVRAVMDWIADLMRPHLEAPGGPVTGS
jgi:hypothetical protein